MKGRKWQQPSAPFSPFEGLINISGMLIRNMDAT